MGLHWVPGHDGVLGNEVANKLARDISVPKFVGPQPSLEVSRQNIRRMIKCWTNNSIWHGGKVLVVLKRQARELTSLIQLQRPDFCPVTGQNPGFLLAFLLDIIP